MPRPFPGDAIGRQSLAVAALALVCTVLPVIGDAISVPVALVALVLGMIGLRRYERGTARFRGPAVAGVALSLLSLFAVAIIALATHL